MGPAEVARTLDADAGAGLTEAEAARRLARHGPNLMPRDRAPAPWRLLARQFAGLPVAMLAGSAGLSLVAGRAVDAAATLAVVGVNGVLGYVTEAQAERTIHTLMDASSSRVTVRRDGAASEIAASRLVPGDLMLLGPGVQVPADARLVSADRLMADESALTGESLPVEKRADGALPRDAPLSARPTMLHAGTIVSEGQGAALVVATGAGTEAARTQRLSAGATRPQARIEAELDRLGERLALASLAACAAFAVIGLMRGYAPAVILKDALALAVAAVPEGLPMVATSTLSRGAAADGAAGHPDPPVERGRKPGRAADPLPRQDRHPDPEPDAGGRGLRGGRAGGPRRPGAGAAGARGAGEQRRRGGGGGAVADRDRPGRLRGPLRGPAGWRAPDAGDPPRPRPALDGDAA
jgi:P-type Ca2+ transporter type 2C